MVCTPREWLDFASTNAISSDLNHAEYPYAPQYAVCMFAGHRGTYLPQGSTPPSPTTSFTGLWHTRPSSFTPMMGKAENPFHVLRAPPSMCVQGKGPRGCPAKVSRANVSKNRCLLFLTKKWQAEQQKWQIGHPGLGATRCCNHYCLACNCQLNCSGDASSTN